MNDKPKFRSGVRATRVSGLSRFESAAVEPDRVVELCGTDTYCSEHQDLAVLKGEA
jgi:hypothetical protein